jgi:heptosyltransferase-2
VSVIELLAEQLDLPVVLVCGPGEEPFLAQVGRAVKRTRPLALVDPVAGLGELVALCAGARVVLTADSGPRHVALAAGARVVCVAGPTDPRHAADHLEELRLVRRVVECGPCHREVCPLTGAAHHACMSEIQPAELVECAVALVE